MHKVSQLLHALWGGDDVQTVPRTETVLEEQWGADGPQTTRGKNGNGIAQSVGWADEDEGGRGDEQRNNS